MAEGKDPENECFNKSSMSVVDLNNYVSITCLWVLNDTSWLTQV